MLRRSGGSVRAGDDTTLSPTRISPADGSTKPAISRSVVVLPQPDGPSRQTSWPCSIVQRHVVDDGDGAVALGQTAQLDRRHALPPIAVRSFPSLWAGEP